MKPLTNYRKVWSNDLAFWEGWGVFSIDGDPTKPRIQRLDDPRAIHSSYPNGPCFASDAEAVLWVKRKASEGSEYHMKALALL